MNLRKSRMSPLFAVVLAAGCAAGREARVGSSDTSDRREGSQAQVVEVGREDARGPGTDPSEIVVLRRVTLPTDRPQSVRISLVERRETSGQGFPTAVHELKLQIEATLTRGEFRGSSMDAVLEFDRVVLSFGRTDLPGDMRSYDSARDEPGTGNDLADLMSIVAGAQARITLQATGQFVELHGLDTPWRKEKVLLAPPALMTAQWLFRDIDMGDLVAEAIFPPMPADSVRPGEEWEMQLPANLMLAAKLRSRLTARLAEVDTSRARRPKALIRMTGKLEPASEIYEANQAGMFPEVVSSTHEVDLTVEPHTHSLMQSSFRQLELRMVMQPPEGQGKLEMTIKQTRRLTSQRGQLRN